MTVARVAEPCADLTFSLVRSYAMNAENRLKVLGTFSIGLISIKTLLSVLMKI